MCRGSQADLDRFIFDLFKLNNEKDISKEELLIMLCNLPSKCSINTEQQDKTQAENKDDHSFISIFIYFINESIYIV